MRIQQLYIYPIKSTRAYQVSQAFVQPQGLNFDREFMLTEVDGTFITARKEAELFSFSAFPLPLGLSVHHRQGDSIQIAYRDFKQQEQCEVWGNHFPSWIAPETINQWFSAKMGRDVQLRWLGETSQRYIKNTEQSVSFADSYPILLTSHTSLKSIQEYCEQPIQMQQFRPNIVIDGEVAFAEQEWQRIQIGEVIFIHTKPCERCILTTRDPHNAQMHPKMEPFRTLKKINPNEKGKPLFGINLVPLNSGVIYVGDELQLL